MYGTLVCRYQCQRNWYLQTEKYLNTNELTEGCRSFGQYPSGPSLLLLLAHLYFSLILNLFFHGFCALLKSRNFISIFLLLLCKNKAVRHTGIELRRFIPPGSLSDLIGVNANSGPNLSSEVFIDLAGKTLSQIIKMFWGVFDKPRQHTREISLGL